MEERDYPTCSVAGDTCNGDDQGGGTMAYEYASYAKKGHIATITINRPQVLNAVHPPATVELSAIWDDAIADDNVWVVILTGAGDKAFSAGNDLKYTAEKGMPSGPRPKGGFGGITDRTDVWKPLIAAVNGFALGGGFEMALRSEEHTSELQSRGHLVCRLLLEKK